MQDAAKLQRFFQSKRPMLLVLGKHAAHRTRMLEHASTTATPDQMVLRIKARTTCSSVSLTELFKKHWAVTINQATKNPNDQLNEILDCLSTRKQSCLLLIDHAHLLPIDVLSALCYLSQQQEHQLVSIRIILAGYPELASKIHALYSTQFPEPHTISLASSEEPNKISQPTTPLVQSFSMRLWLGRTVKAIAVIGLVSSGILWWHLQETSHSINFAKTSINQWQNNSNEDIYIT